MARTYVLTCKECGAIFEFEYDDISYLLSDASASLKPDRAPAECPNGHIAMYTLGGASASDG
jgi:hypothetical protein